MSASVERRERTKDLESQLGHARWQHVWPLSVGVPVKCTSTAALATPILDWCERPEHQQFTTRTYINLYIGPWFRVLFVFPFHHKSGVLATAANLRDGRMYSANKFQKAAEWCHITPTPLPPYTHDQILTTVCICHVWFISWLSDCIWFCSELWVLIRWFEETRNQNWGLNLCCCCFCLLCFFVCCLFFFVFLGGYFSMLLVSFKHQVVTQGARFCYPSVELGRVTSCWTVFWFGQSWPSCRGHFNRLFAAPFSSSVKPAFRQWWITGARQQQKTELLQPHQRSSCPVAVWTFHRVLTQWQLSSCRQLSSCADSFHRVDSFHHVLTQWQLPSCRQLSSCADTETESLL